MPGWPVGRDGIAGKMCDAGGKASLSRISFGRFNRFRKVEDRRRKLRIGGAER